MSTTKIKDFAEEIARYEIMKEYFSVNFETGLITRLKVMGSRGKIGDIAKVGYLGYVHFRFNWKVNKGHRFIFYCYHGTLHEEIDHKNGVKHDNRISNLRGGTKSQNLQNQTKPHSHNKSGYLGVYWSNQRKKYRSTIRVNNKIKDLGFFEKPELAYEAYLAAKRKLHDFCEI